LGVSGITSNPTIFAKAIAASSDYDDQLQGLAAKNKPPKEIYESLAIEDTRLACDLLRPVYAHTEGRDGYVSLEANPHLAHDTEATIAEVRRLWELVNRPNLMIKVPATAEGVPAIQALTAAGMNINVTLIFSLDQYDLVAGAYLSGLEERAQDHDDLSQLASVASFFVSRIDVKVDQKLARMDDPAAQKLLGITGIANAKMAYQHYQEKFSGERWSHLAAQGARAQRVLYGSTSTKNPAYADTLYVDNLIGKNTVNTVPPATLEAFRDHGTAAATLERGLSQARQQFQSLDHLGVDMQDITQELLAEGVEKFSQSYDQLIESISEKKGELLTA
jgi:transaldolase